MVEKNPLYRRMIHDVQLPNLSPVTQRCYVTHSLGTPAVPTKIARPARARRDLHLADRLTTTGISSTARHRRVRSGLFSCRFNPCCGMHLSPNVRCQTKGSAENRGGGPAEFRRSGR